MPLTKDETAARHKELHRSLDELFACYITEHPGQISYLQMPLCKFMEWSCDMTRNPTCGKGLTHVPEELEPGSG